MPFWDLKQEPQKTMSNKDSSCDSMSLSAFGDISGSGFDYNNSDGVASHCFHPVDLIYLNACFSLSAEAFDLLIITLSIKFSCKCSPSLGSP